MMTGDEKLQETEQLLREAAAWEPERAAPDRITQLALAVALSRPRDPKPRRNSAGAFLFALVMGGGASAAALSGTLLMVMSPRADLPLTPLRTPKATLAGWAAPAPESASAAETPAPSRVVVHRAPTRRTAPRIHLAAAPVPRRSTVPRAVWTTEEVVQRKEGVLAPGVLVEPDLQSGVIHLLPTIVDIPVSPDSSACAPPMPRPSEALLPPPPGFPEFEPGFNQEGPR